MCSKTSYVFIQVDFLIFLEEMGVKSWCFLLRVYSNVWRISYENPNSDILISIFVKSSNFIFWRRDHHFQTFEWELLNFCINLMLRETKSVRHIASFSPWYYWWCHTMVLTVNQYVINGHTVRKNKLKRNMLWKGKPRKRKTICSFTQHINITLCHA